MSSWRTLAAFTTLAVVATGCGGSGDKAAQSPTAPVTLTTPTTTLEAESATPSPSPSFEPNVGARALRVGQARQGKSVATTLREIRYPYPPAEYYAPDPGKQFVGLRIKQCVKKDANLGGEPYPGSYVGEWYIVSPDGAQVTTNESWNDWPEPKFPENVTSNPGECLKGWMLIPVRKGMKVKKVVWRPEGNTTAEWLP